MNSMMKATALAVLALVGGLSAAQAQSANGPNGQSGTATSVNVVNTPTVYVVNDGVKDLMTIWTSLGLANGVKSLTASSFYVPSGQRFVMEYVSASCSFAQASQAILSVNVGGVLMNYLPLVGSYWPSETVRPYRAAASSPLRAYADGPTVKFTIDRSVTTGDALCAVVVNGYLAPLQ